MSESTGRLLFGEEQRLRFLEFGAGGPEAAGSMVAISEMHTQQTVADIFENDHSPRDAGEDSSRLNWLINEALINEATSRMDSSDAAAQEAYERKVAGRELFIDLVFKPGELISTKSPVTDLLIGEMLSGAQDAITSAATSNLEVELGPVPGLNADSDFSISANHISTGGAIIDYYLSNGTIDSADLDSYEYLGTEDGSFALQNYDSDVQAKVKDEIDALLSSVDGGRGAENLEAYLDAYHTTRTDDQSNTGVDTSDRPEADNE